MASRLCGCFPTPSFGNTNSWPPTETQRSSPLPDPCSQSLPSGGLPPSDYRSGPPPFLCYIFPQPHPFDPFYAPPPSSSPARRRTFPSGFFFLSFSFSFSPTRAPAIVLTRFFFTQFVHKRVSRVSFPPNHSLSRVFSSALSLDEKVPILFKGFPDRKTLEVGPSPLRHLYPSLYAVDLFYLLYLLSNLSLRLASFATS